MSDLRQRLHSPQFYDLMQEFKHSQTDLETTLAYSRVLVWIEKVIKEEIANGTQI